MSSNNKTEFKQNKLFEAIVEHKESIPAIAKATNMSRSTLYRNIGKLDKLSIKNFISIAEELGIDPKDFF